MKNVKLLSSLIFVFLNNLMFCQSDSTYFLHDIKRINRQKIGMQALGGWSIANIATGIALKNNVKGEDFYFNQMNIAWNVFNLGIASIGYLNVRKEKPSVIAMDVHQKQLKLEKAFLFNSGLDVAYVCGGLWLLERARNYENPKEFDRFRGLGRSLILQGTYLFLFDLSFYLIETSHANKLREAMNLFFLSKGQLGMRIKF